jgi:hypothetical protein
MKNWSSDARANYPQKGDFSAWIHNPEIHQKRLNSYVSHILLLKFCYIFKFLVGF